MEMRFGNRLVSFLFKLICTMFSTVWLIVLVVMILQSRMEEDPEPVLIALVAVMFCIALLLMYFLLIEVASGELTEEGVYVRVLLNRRFYPWASIRQAGILYCMGRGTRYNSLVLLKPGGSPRRYRDGLFAYRNAFHLIFLGGSPAIREYVIRHYGPLDFDLSDGRPERSEVVD